MNNEKIHLPGILEKIKTQTLTQNEVNQLNGLAPIPYYKNAQLTDLDKEFLREYLEILQYIYNSTSYEVPVSDETYDLLYEIFLNATNSNIIGAPVNEVRKTAYHKYPDLRGTLDKIHFITDIDKGKDNRKSFEGWLRSAENKIGYNIPYDTPLIIFPKFDGVSIIFECEPDNTVSKALTRGDVSTNEAQDVSNIFLPIDYKYTMTNETFGKDGYGIKNECVISLDDFDEMVKVYGDFNSPRSAISSIINSKIPDSNIKKYITVVGLSIQDYATGVIETHNDLLYKYPTFKTTLGDLLEDGISNKLKSKFEKDMGIVIDGLVIRLDDKKLIKDLGREDNINKYEVAYKFPPEMKKSIIESVDFSIGNLGNITPVAKIQKVKINRNEIKSISLGSIDRFKTLHLAPGDEVYVKYDIIPYLDVDDSLMKSGNPEFDIPKRCPSCDEILVYEPVLRCGNLNCPSRMIGKILNYVTKLNIKNISIETITNFYNIGILRSIEDLYKLKKHSRELKSLPGFGERSIDLILDGIASIDTLKDYELLGSIGIPNIGRRIFEKILSIYYLSDLIEICKKRETTKLSSLPGIGDETANKVIEGVLSNIDLIKYLSKKITITSTMDEIVSYHTSVVFTDGRDGDFEKWLDDNGVKVASSVSKNVNFVISGNTSDTKTSKELKADKYGIPIISFNEAYKMFNYSK